jgi:hypothetical protein
LVEKLKHVLVGGSDVCLESLLNQYVARGRPSAEAASRLCHRMLRAVPVIDAESEAQLLCARLSLVQGAFAERLPLWLLAMLIDKAEGEVSMCADHYDAYRSLFAFAIGGICGLVDVGGCKRNAATQLLVRCTQRAAGCRHLALLYDALAGLARISPRAAKRCEHLFEASAVPIEDADAADAAMIAAGNLRDEQATTSDSDSDFVASDDSSDDDDHDSDGALDNDGGDGDVDNDGEDDDDDDDDDDDFGNDDDSGGDSDLGNDGDDGNDGRDGNNGGNEDSQRSIDGEMACFFEECTPPSPTTDDERALRRRWWAQSLDERVDGAYSAYKCWASGVAQVDAYALDECEPHLRSVLQA